MKNNKWEKEFKEKFADNVNQIIILNEECRSVAHCDDIKSFINKTLQEQREEIIEKIKATKLDERKAGIFEGFTVETYDEKMIYNQGLNDALNILDTLK